MSCEYSINLNGNKKILFTLEGEPIDNYEKLVAEVRKQSSKNPQYFKEILEELNKVSRFEEVNIDDINENSVGFYSPTDLISDISQNKTERSYWNRLNISTDTKNKSNVVVGFGTNGESTGLYKKHIYVNLNYTDDYSNKIIALTELALHENFPDYKGDFINIVNSDEVENYLNKIIKTTNKRDLKASDLEAITFLKRKIKAAYYKSEIKTDIGSRNLSIAKENLKDTFNTFDQKSIPENRNLNYLPQAYIKVSDLKQGDLVLIPNKDSLTSRNVSSWYEIFFDSYIDPNGKNIIRTVHQTRDGEYFLKKHEASQFTKDGDTQKIIQSETVQARLFSQDEYNAYNYSNDSKYVEIPLKKHGKIFKFEWTMDLLRNPETQIILKKKRGPKSTQLEESGINEDEKISEVDPASKKLKIKSLKGSIVTLESGEQLGISDIDYLAVSANLFQGLNEDPESLTDSFNFNYHTPSVGDRILTNKKDKTIIGKVIGFSKTDDVSKIIYVYNEGKEFKTGSTTFVKAVAYPNDNSLDIPLSQLSNMHKLILGKLKGNNVGQSVIINKGEKGLNVENMTYSIEDINKYSSFKSGNILFNTKMNTFHKILESKAGFIKTVGKVNGKLVYLNINKDNLSDYVMFTDSINKSFANASLWKNRYSIYTSPSSNTQEVKVWKNPNGYIWTYNVNSSKTDLKSHNNYEEGMIDYTSQMKQILKDRYKLSELPKALYISNDYNRDNYNTVPLAINNSNFKTIMDNKLLNFIVPGSFITFRGDRDSYIVEKNSNDGLVLAKYVYTKNKSNNVSEIDSDLAYVKSEKFILTKDLLDNGLEIGIVHLPRWATASYETLQAFKSKTDVVKKSIEDSDFSDSKEFVVQVANLIKEKYGVDVNLLHNSEIAEFGNPELFNSAAFVQNGQIYINIDKASIAEPLHELLHLVLASMKANDSANYYRIINAVQYHPMFKQVSKQYSDINSEVLEETFIKLFTKTFRKNVKREGVFNQDVFNRSIKQTVQDMLDLSEPLDWEDTFDIMGKPIKDILVNFGSSLLKNEEGLIDSDKVAIMFEVTGAIRELMEQGKLEQNCNY